MKKTIVLLIITLILVGCGEVEFNKTCSFKTESPDITDKETRKIFYNNKDQITKVIITKTYISKHDHNVINDIQKSAKNYNNNLAKEDSIKIKEAIDDNKYTITYYLDVLNLDEKQIKEFELNTNSIKYFNKMKKRKVVCQ